MTNKTYLAKYNAYKSKEVVKDDSSLLFWVVLLTLIFGLCTN